MMSRDKVVGEKQIPSTARRLETKLDSLEEKTMTKKLKTTCKRAALVALMALVFAVPQRAHAAAANVKGAANAAMAIAQA
jgi:hypothetical protein